MRNPFGETLFKYIFKILLVIVYNLAKTLRNSVQYIFQVILNIKYIKLLNSFLIRFQKRNATEKFFFLKSKPIIIFSFVLGTQQLGWDKRQCRRPTRGKTALK